MKPSNAFFEPNDFHAFLKKLLAGDEGSWRTLEFVMRRIISKWMINRGVETRYCDEVFQEVITTFYEKIPGGTFQDFRNLKSFAFSIAENKIKEKRREVQRSLKNTEISGLNRKYYFEDHHLISIEEEKIKKMLAEKILENLKPLERKILVNVFYEDKSLQETASQLGITYGQARTTKSRLMKRLRTKYIKYSTLYK